MSYNGYSYNVLAGQAGYQNGTTMMQAPYTLREPGVAARGPAAPEQHHFQRQMPVQERPDALGGMNAPRRLPYDALAYGPGPGILSHPSQYAPTSGLSQQASPHARRQSLSSYQGYWHQTEGQGTSLPPPQSPTSPTDLAPLMSSTSLGGTGRRDPFYPTATSMPAFPQMTIPQPFGTQGSVPRSTPQSAEWAAEADQKKRELYASFKRKVKSRQFFVIGKVFLTLWHESAGEQGSNATEITSSISVGPFGERIHSKIRRFVVVREGELSCTALPILTYGRQGVTKPRVKKSEHAVIHTGKDVPPTLPRERAGRGEDPLLSPIRVDPDDIAEKLDPLSRVDFGKAYCIEHNVKVRSFGKVNAASIATLSYQFRRVWAGTLKESISQTPVKTSKVVRAETTETTKAPQPPDPMHAYHTLLASGYSPDVIRSMLRTEFLPAHSDNSSLVASKSRQRGTEDHGDSDDEDLENDDDDS